MYALSGSTRREFAVPGDSAGRNLSGRDRRVGGPHSGHRRKAHAGSADFSRSRCRVTGACQKEHGGASGQGQVCAFSFLRPCGRALPTRGGQAGRIAGGSWRKPLPVDGARKGLLADGRWSGGYANGPQSGDDGGRSSQLYRRKGTSRFDLSTRRRKEGEENSQSNRSCAANSKHGASSTCHRGGCAADGPSASGYQNLYGFTV